MICIVLNSATNSKYKNALIQRNALGMNVIWHPIAVLILYVVLSLVSFVSLHGLLKFYSSRTG
uniref:Uncharacterized protein n=1 Tax=Arundo donax TaxID=35708 RepID=A0A0A9BQS8_ARUDO